MNTRALWITIVLFTAIVFGANYYAARNVSCAEDCVKCNCTVKLKFPDVPKAQEPSCSVIFSRPWPYVGTAYTVFKLSRLTKTEGGFLECDTAVVCDQGSEMEMLCKNRIGSEWKDYKTTIFPQNICTVRCSRIEGDLFPPIFGWKGIPGGRVTRTNCEHWERMPPKSSKKKPGGRQPGGEFGMMTGGSSPESEPGSATFVPASFSFGQTGDEEWGETVTNVAWWKAISGDAGTDEGVLTVTDGEVAVRSFCTGDAAEVTDTGTIALPVCPVDILGRWQGGYARKHRNGTMSQVPITLDIRKDGRYIGGDLTTPDGTFKITSVNQTSSHLEIRSTGTVEGKQVDIVLSGRPGKGEIAFGGREGTPGQISTGIIGFVRRLYIADSALPRAVVGDRYDFKLLAFPPENQKVAFALTEGKLPRGLSFDASSGTFSGTPSETGRFNIRITATDSSGASFDQPFTLEVKKLALANKWLPDAVIGQPYSATLKVLGGRPPYKFTGGVPTGLTLDPATGEISGTPTRPGSTIYAVYFTDSQNTYDGDLLRLMVRGTTITNSHYLADAKKGMPVRVQFKAIGNTLPINWYISGNVLPMTQSGLSINPQTGELTGAPNKTGTFVFSVTARGGESQTRKFALTVTQ